ncbi:hypothetical protein, partial [Aquabacterium sp.]|uniref:hypothetical protein n=1 Tax=Aquabacterium sp. TaxID=1872578 RepID=UPI003D6C7A33
RRQNQELVSQLASYLVSAGLFIPRSTVQAIFDSASGESALKLALKSVLDSGDQLILKSTIQSILNSTPQPDPELATRHALEPADTRPIWPLRPELIYQRYIANKETWLTAHLEVQPDQYRTARGFKNHSKRWINQNRKNLGLQRLNLDTETLGPIKTLATLDWTNEEVEAWLDWDTQDSIEVENRVERELVAAGGFGQDMDRGVWRAFGRFRSNLEVQKAQYRFAPL